MKLTTKGQYAIVALTHLKNKGSDPVRIQEVAKEEKISHHYLEQLFRSMRVAGLVRSVRGPGGGYLLQDGITINYKMVLEAVGEKVSLRESIVDRSEASNDVVTNLNLVHNKLTKFFEELTI